MHTLPSVWFNFLTWQYYLPLYFCFLETCHLLPPKLHKAFFQALVWMTLSINVTFIEFNHSHSASSQETVILEFNFFLLLSLFCCCLVLTKTTQLDLQIDCEGLYFHPNLKVKRLIQGNYTFYMTVIVLAYHICLYYRCNDFKCWLHCI